MGQDRQAPVLHDFVDHPLVILHGVIRMVLLNNVLLEGHAAADAQNMVAVGILPAFDEDVFAFPIRVHDGPEHVLFPGGGMVGNGQEAVVHPGRRLGAAGVHVMAHGLLQGMAAVRHVGVGVKAAAQPGAFLKIRGNPAHEKTSFFIVSAGWGRNWPRRCMLRPRAGGAPLACSGRAGTGAGVPRGG